MIVDHEGEDEGRRGGTGSAARNPDGSCRSVVAMFASWARSTPEATALVTRQGSHSYRELNERANRLAHHLLGVGAGVGGRVGLCLARSADLVVAMLAVLKTGAAYVPLEKDQSPARLRLMAEENSIGLAVTAGDWMSGDEAWLPRGTRVVDAHDPAIGEQASSDPDVSVLPEDVMYVPYTSGSTGRPKGTEVPHRAVAGFFQGETYAFWGPGSVSVHHSSLSWDGHVLDLYPALLSGGTVVVFEGEPGDPLAVARTAARHHATILWLTAAAFNAVVDVDVRLLNGLDHLLVGGETLSPAHVSRALAGLPGTRIVNGYGPSECTVFSTVHTISEEDVRDEGGIPIGRAVGDRTVHLLDDSGARVADGGVGELCVGGPGVAHGYLGRPRLTAERFVPDTTTGVPGARMYRTGDRARLGSDGLLRFGGRSDDQVKIRGFRVEPGEVTQLLRRDLTVRDAVVVPRKDPDGRYAGLTAYVVPFGPGKLSEDRMLQRLREQLPDVMVPSGVVVLDRMPLTPNGKLDKAALPEPDAPGRASTTPYRPPETDTERRVAALWRELLEVDDVGRDHDFFQLGGQSLLASRLVGRLQLSHGVDISLRTLYRAPRLTDVAAEVDRLCVLAKKSQNTSLPRIARVDRRRRRVVE